MDKLTSPKFKSKVEQFYYENGASSELDLTAADEVFAGEESPRRNEESPRNRFFLRCTDILVGTDGMG